MARFANPDGVFRDVETADVERAALMIRIALQPDVSQQAHDALNRPLTTFSVTCEPLNDSRSIWRNYK
jgi:hypothetical protein